MPRGERIGQPASPGFAIGPLATLAALSSESRAVGDATVEQATLAAALAASVADLEHLAAQAGGEAAEILEFQVALLQDEALSDPVFQAIAEGKPAATAWRAAMDTQIADYESADDGYFRARAADLRDLADRVSRHLLGAGQREALPPGAILLADDLTPSAFLEADWSRGGGIALRHGSPASHLAMLARSRGVPMVVGLGALAAESHAEAALDGTGGVLWLSPDAHDRERFAARACGAAQEAAEAAAHALRPAVTAGGRRIAVLLNVADPADLAGIDPAICDGIGLTRTELLFPASGGLPDEDAQCAVYHRLLEWAAGRPVTIRTLDAGGDKPIAGLTIAGESNPFLGVRGIRLSLLRPEIFAVQLRALARAAAHGPLKIMLPMITVPDELEAARSLLDRAMQDLAARHVPAQRPPLGIMVEVPAAALAIERFDAAFYSIGSNDLTQYVTASARDIGAVAGLADLRNPGVLRLIAEVAAHGRRVGREVSVCGDAAGNPALVPALLDAGIECLSMAPNAVPAVKARIAQHG